MKTLRMIGSAILIAWSTLTATAQDATASAVFSQGVNYQLTTDYDLWFNNYRYARDNGLTEYGTLPYRFQATDILHPLQVLAGFAPVLPPNWEGVLNPSGPTATQQGSSGYYLTSIISPTPNLFMHDIRVSYGVVSGNGESFNVESMIAWGRRADGTWVQAPDHLEPLTEIIVPVRIGLDVYTQSSTNTTQSVGDLWQDGINNALGVSPVRFWFTTESYSGVFAPIQNSILISSSEVPEPSTWAAIVAIGGIFCSVGFRAWRRRSQA